MNIKASFIQRKEKVFRRFKVETYEEFVAKAKTFSGKKDEKELTFQYLDEENDYITFSTKQEFDEYFEFHQRTQNGKTLRVNIISQPEKKAKEDGIEFVFSRFPFGGFGHPRCHRRNPHCFPRCSPRRPNINFGVVCDGCNKENFHGHRFKCKDCPDYDLCSGCFKNVGKIHPGHVFMKKETKPFHCMWKPEFRCPRNVKKQKEEKKEKKKTQPEIKKQEPEVKKQETETPKVEKLYPEVPKEIPEVKVEKKEEKKEEFLYQSQLGVLEKMGFVNTSLNKHLLNVNKGDLRRVVATILSLDK